MRLPAVLAALAVSCSSADPGPEMGPREEAARTSVWDDTFGAEDAEPPWVEWWYDDCPGTDRTAVILDGVCYSGYFRPGTWRADVAWRGSFSGSAYAHELLHAWQYARGIDDPNHSLPEWDLVRLANERLRDMGM